MVKNFKFVSYLFLVVVIIGTLCFYGCGDQQNDQSQGSTEQSTSVSTAPSGKVKKSVKNYVGINCGNLGLWDNAYKCVLDSSYNNGVKINLTLKSEDGSQVTKDNLQNYVVTKQSVPEGTEIQVEYRESGYADKWDPENITLTVIKVA